MPGQERLSLTRPPEPMVDRYLLRPRSNDGSGLKATHPEPDPGALLWIRCDVLVHSVNHFVVSTESVRGFDTVNHRGSILRAGCYDFFRACVSEGADLTILA
jgi:hypothetical protein